MKANQFSKLVTFLERLDEAKILYSMEHSRDDAVMVQLVVPGEYWEIEFMEDGAVEIERYKSNGKICDESMLQELYTIFAADAEPAPPETANQHDAVARK